MQNENEKQQVKMPTINDNTKIIEKATINEKNSNVKISI